MGSNPTLGTNMAFSDTKRKQSIKELLSEMTDLVRTIRKLESHTKAKCAKGEHITRGGPTGGRSGEYMTYCLACDYSEFGYD